MTRLPDGRCLICGHRGVHVCFDGPRASDYERAPGRTVEVRIGPFTFGVDTADGGRVGFSFEAGRFGAVWTLGSTR